MGANGMHRGAAFDRAPIPILSLSYSLAAGIYVDYTLFFTGRVHEAIMENGGRGMRKRISAFLSIVLFISIACGAFAEDEVARDKKKAQDLIQKAIEHIKKAGKELAFKDFTAKDGGFVDGSFYIFVVDFKGMTLAHGGNPALVGQSMYELKDADGKLFIQDFIKVAREKGSAWVDYKWSNPTTKKVEPKSTFVKRMEGTDFFLGCGIYLKK
jgi:cytochrome c